MEAEAWLSDLRAAVGEVIGAAGTADAPATVGDDERDVLLDLARVAAHSSERWTAPISTYLVGLALADVDPSQRAAKLRELLSILE